MWRFTQVNVVFVEDDELELTRLRDMMAPFEQSWQMTFVDSAEDALNVLKNEAIDVIVSDMSMPRMDGSELFRAVKAEHPDVVRIIMSNRVEMPRVMRMVSIAHQFLTKPCDPAELRSSVARAAEMHVRLSNPELRKVIGQIGSLPSPSAVVMDLNAILARPDAQIRDVTHVVEDDIAISAKILQMVNSAYFGLSHEMTDLRDAVAYLGLDTVRNLTLAVEVFRTLGNEQNVASGVVDELHNHSAAVAHLARELVIDKQHSHDAYVGALLHDVGHLALATRSPERFEQIRSAVSEGGNLLEAERELLGATHADIGAYLLQLWGLPYRVIETVARHHDAPDLADTGMNSVHAAYIAEHLLSEQMERADGFWEFGNEETILDPVYLAKLQMTERVASWRAFQEGVY
jgi:putative nucleotidyltransferase with HDIG domain